MATPAGDRASDPSRRAPQSTPSRWQLMVSSSLLLLWILFLAWIALTG